VQITAGTPSKVTLNVATTPAGMSLPADVNYTCGFPSALVGTTCLLSPAKTIAGSASGSTTLTISTTAIVPPLSRRQGPWELYPLWIVATGLAGLVAIFIATRQKLAGLDVRLVYVTSALLLLTMAGLAGCSAASKTTSTPKGLATVTVTSTSGTISKTTTINISVK
jgi:hypothetical protein